MTVGPLGEQLWGYWYLVDGVKVLDPGNGEYSARRRPYDNRLMIPGAVSDRWDFKDVPHGTMQSVWYPSPTLKQDRRRMYVYTPPGYEANRPAIPSCTCCTAVAAMRTRGSPWAAPTSSWTT